MWVGRIPHVLVTEMDFHFLRYERNEEKCRTEIDFVAKYTGPVPSRSELLEHLSTYYSFPEDAAVLDRLKSRAGRGEVRGSVRVYEDAESLKRYERTERKKRR
jgi:ribosomal protein S24E